MGRIVHVLGTSTGVGKTAVACALARGLRAREVDVSACKPFACGEDPGRLPSDAAALVEAAGAGDGEDLVAPVRFALPASPWAASKAQGRETDVGCALHALRTLAGRHTVLIVEGIGGVAVPLAPGATYLDFLREMPGKCLVVARAGLGTLNHTLLTIEALSRRGLEAAGVVLNRPEAGSDPSEAANPEAIETFGGVKVLASLPHAPGRDLALPDAAIDAVLRP